MYTILVNPDNTLYGSQKSRIMQRSKLVDNLRFIVEPIYNDVDMTSATVMLEYVLPVSRKYKTALLVLDDERYNNCFLQYKLPFDTGMTNEAGSLELQLTFAYVEMDTNGVGIQRVRKTSPTTIEVIPITAWSDIVPDDALSSLDERLIKLDSQMRAMNDYLDVLDNNQVDDLVYDDNKETLQLYANGKGVGSKVSVRDILDDGIPTVDLDSDSDNDSDDNTDDDSCNCDDCSCENNAVEFGDITASEDSEEDDGNNVEF